MKNDFIQLKNIKQLQYNIDELLDYRKTMFKKIINFWKIDYSKIYDRNNFSNKKGLKGITLSTSGSTGEKFKYQFGFNEFKFIETELHYNQIIEEFGLSNQKIKILRVSPDNYELDFEKIYWKNKYFKIKIFHPSKTNFNYSHGSDQATCYHFKYDKNHIIEFCEFLLDYISKEKMDIFLTSFSFLSILIECNFKNIKIARLISNTCESIIDSQVLLMSQHKMMDYFCDHMRGWDGGFTFITCKYGKKHILDYLSFVESFNNKLISTDFHNYSSPFIRYWNGDYISIEKEWKKCECGRFYRKFIFESRRKSFTINNITSIDLYDVVKNINKTIQLVCYKNKINVITCFELSFDEKKYLIDNINYELDFKINQFQQSGRFNKISKILDKTNEYE